jgi:hypothetical protein
MKELNSIYEDYPGNAEVFINWRKKVTSIIEDAKERFKPNPV